jgi:hypothetical protein
LLAVEHTPGASATVKEDLATFAAPLRLAPGASTEIQLTLPAPGCPTGDASLRLRAKLGAQQRQDVTVTPSSPTGNSSWFGGDCPPG